MEENSESNNEIDNEKTDNSIESKSSKIKVSKQESKLALIFGVIGALSETFSIYLLANLITNLDKNKLIINIKFLNQVSFSKEIYILFFLISAILSAFLYFLSNKNIVK